MTQPNPPHETEGGPLDVVFPGTADEQLGLGAFGLDGPTIELASMVVQAFTLACALLFLWSLTTLLGGAA